MERTTAQAGDASRLRSPMNPRYGLGTWKVDQDDVKSKQDHGEADQDVADLENYSHAG